MNIECPECGFDNDLDSDDLPERACDSESFECKKCEHEFLIGWSAEAELR
jgi:DNA primase catalytic subunit